MKIGFSLGRCIADIVSGKVKERDVLCIITNTAIKPDDFNASTQKRIMMYYKTQGYIDVDADLAAETSIRLYLAGKIHQPRLYTDKNSQTWNFPIWMNLSPDHNDSNETLKQHWDAYASVVRLLSTQTNSPFDDNF
jgi:hypothetical protein